VTFALVTPNPDLDITLRRLGGGTDREVEVELAVEAAGGKANNAARLLAALGHECTALGFSGGWAGRRIEELLGAAGVRCALTPIRQPSRVYITISDAAGTRQLSYHARGPCVDAAETASLLAAIAAIPDAVERVVIGGSLPRGMGEDWYATAVGAAGRDRVWVDAAGPNLRAALGGGARRAKVNLHELWGLVEGDGARDLRHAGHWVARVAELHGMERLCVTLGRRGAIGWGDGHLVRAQGLAVEVKNTVGAGDAFMAGMLHGEAAGASFPDQLRWGVAAGSAVCEQVDPAAVSVDRIRGLVGEVAVRGGAPAGRQGR
jgi:6-phosphofructokinase 2